MSNNLFNKCVAFTDIHWGKQSNSEEYNQKALNFVEWFIEEGNNYGADTCIFLGDWHDSRISVQVKTLNYSLIAMEKLAKAFKNFIFIPGNHDIFHRTRRDYNSIEFARNIKNVTIINHPKVIGNVGLVPWMVGDEWKKVKEFKCHYMFGHFELPHFKMNAMVDMPDHGTGIKKEDLGHCEYVFSGHFHKRQDKNNIWYIGNAFPQNFSDAGDDDRGMMFLEWGGKPKFKSWPDQPVFRIYNLSDILDEPEKAIHANVNARVNIDIHMTYEEAQALKESFVKSYNAESIKFIQKNKEVEETDWEGNVEFLSVDQIVIDGLTNLDDDSIYDKKTLIELYNSLEVKG